MPRGKDGSIIGDATAVSITSASGIWTMSEVHKYETEGTWPDPKPIGGTTSDYTDFNIHTYTDTGETLTFVVTNTIVVDILVVGGGGSGGGRWAGGGGGGGLIYLSDVTLAAGTYTATIGDGGASVGYGFPGLAGAETTFIQTAGGTTVSLAADGGGGGGLYHEPLAVLQDGGSSGGSPGMDSTDISSSRPATQGAVSPYITHIYPATGTPVLTQKGYVGGDGATGSGGGGGGGAGAAGSAAAAAGGATTAGTGACKGGIGHSIANMGPSGVTYYWAGGGGGSMYVTSSPAVAHGGAGGSGGGGGGATSSGTGGVGGIAGLLGLATGEAGESGANGDGGDGGDNTGGGGGGVGGEQTGSDPRPTSGAGGSGIVIVRYAA